MVNELADYEVSWNFPVEVFRVYRGGAPRRDSPVDNAFVALPDAKAVVRTDTGRTLYIGSGQYVPVSHRRIFGDIVGRVDDLGMDVTLNVSNHGARVFVQFEDQHPRDDIIPGETVKMGIMVINSLDGTYRFSVDTYIRRPNRTFMLVSEIVNTYRRRHVGDISGEQFADTIIHTMQAAADNIGVLGGLATIPMNLDSFETMLGKLSLSKARRELGRELWGTPEVIDLDQSLVNTAYHALATVAYLSVDDMRDLVFDSVYRVQQKADRRLSTVVKEALRAQENEAQADSVENAGNIVARVQADIEAAGDDMPIPRRRTRPRRNPRRRDAETMTVETESEGGEDADV